MTGTMRAAFQHAIEANRGRVAIEDETRTLAFEEVGAWASAVAAQLLALGVERGDAVSLLTRNRAEFLVADVAVALVGAIKSPINYMLPLDTVAYILSASRAKVVVVDRVLLPLAEAAVATLAKPPVLIVVRDDGQLPEGAHWLADAASAPAALPPIDIAPEMPAALYFTGGTTGRPKGVLHTQASTVALHYAQLLEGEIAQDDRLLLMTPMAHAAGLFAQSAFIRGATSVVTDGFEANRAVQLFVDSAITWTFLVPTMIYRVIDVLTERDVELSLRTVVYGAAPISPTRLEQALDLFGPVFVQLYGQTEMPNWGTRLTKVDHDPARPQLLASCGRASIMADVKVVDPEGRTVADGETGEICLRSPYVLSEYLGDADATKEKFLDDWIRTGDIGVMEEGYLYLRDRKNDMVISGGMNVYSREVEDALSRHPSVKAAAVIGVPHEDWGEAVHAVVVLDEGADVAESELLQWSRAHLAAYARPKSIEFVDALPETAFGKVDKKALREPHWAGQWRSIG